MICVMRDISVMQARIVFLREQAKSFRKQSETTRDPALEHRLAELAESCADVAAGIERSLSIHEHAE
jgi:hypothetical protein